MRFTTYKGSKLAVGKIETHDGTFYVTYRNGQLSLTSETFNKIPSHRITYKIQHELINAWICNSLHRVAVNLTTKS